MNDQHPAGSGRAEDAAQPADEVSAPSEDFPSESDASAETDPLAQEIALFWEAARPHVGIGRVGVITGVGSEAFAPPAWSFGGDSQEADALLREVLHGDKRATTSAVEEYGDDPLPAEGDLSIILDGEGHPRALIRTTAVEVLRFADVDEDFAAAEGEGDRTLASWRAAHRVAIERTLGHAVDDDTPIVCERFELRYPGGGMAVVGSPLI